MQLVPEYIHDPEVKFLDILGEYKIKYSDDVLLIHNVLPLSAWHLTWDILFLYWRSSTQVHLLVMAQFSFSKVLLAVIDVYSIV